MKEMDEHRYERCPFCFALGQTPIADGRWLRCPKCRNEYDWPMKRATLDLMTAEEYQARLSAAQEKERRKPSKLAKETRHFEESKGSPDISSCEADT